MKKNIVFIIVLALLMIFSSCSCGTNLQEKSPELPELDDSALKIIDMVYNHISEWDTTVKDGGEDISVDKIGFYKTSDGVLLFVTNYPIGGFRIYGYEVTENNFSPYTGQLDSVEGNAVGIRIGMGGVPWNSNGEKSEIIDTLRLSYQRYLNS